MRIMGVLILLLVAACLPFLPCLIAQRCQDISLKGGFNFNRTFIIKYRGPFAIVATRDTASDNLGSCFTLDQYHDRVASWFLKSYNVDLVALLNSSPFAEHDTDNFTVTPYNDGPSSSNKVIGGSHFTFFKYMNTRLYWTSWLLRPKVPLSGPRGSIPAGHAVYYGVLRTNDHDEDFCMEYYNRNPIGTMTANPAPVDLVVKNNEFGKGAGRGVQDVVEETLTWDWVITFPA